MFRAVIRKEGVQVTEAGDKPETLDTGGSIIAYDQTPELAVERLKKAWEWRLNWAKGLVQESETELALIAAYHSEKKEEN